jgi:hypothetical protein
MTTRGFAHFPAVTRLATALVLAIALAACTTDDPTGLEPDAAPVECEPPSPPAWLGVHCRVLCSHELAMCAGSESFIDCHRECVSLQPAGNFCPLTPAGGAR